MICEKCRTEKLITFNNVEYASDNFTHIITKVTKYLCEETRDVYVQPLTPINWVKLDLNL